MKKILFMMILLGLCSRIAFAEGLSVEEKQIIKDRITANDPGRDLLLDRLLRETDGAEIGFALPYLNDSRADVRAVIAGKLGFYGDPSIAIPALLKAREDKDWVVRMRVARALLQRGKEKEAVPVLVRLIKEGNVYHELTKDISEMKDAEAKELLKKGVYDLKNEKRLSNAKKAYCIIILSYLFNETFTEENKVFVIGAIKDINENSNISDKKPAFRIVMKLWPSKYNKTLTKDVCLDILNNAINSPDKEIAKEARRSRELLLDWKGN